MELSWFKGKHYFSGVDHIPHQRTDRDSEYYDYGDDCLFCIDGVNYLMIEDLNDGYRSNMLDPIFTEREIVNTFEKQEVMIKHREKGSYYGDECDIMEICSMSGDLILEVGTDNIDNWYPSAIFNFFPENMEINKTR